MPVTANSFVLVNSSPARVAQLEAALQYLQSHSPDMAAPMLAQAAENQVRIFFSDPVVNQTDSYGERGHAIVWDPNAGLAVLNRPGGTPIGVESPANGLFHEIVHSLEINQAERNNDNTNPDGQYSNLSEAAATIYANAVAQDCGEPTRPDYASAADIVVSNVTAHTGADANGSVFWYQQNSAGGVDAGPRYQPGAPAPVFGSSGSGGPDPYDGSYDDPNYGRDGGGGGPDPYDGSYDDPNYGRDGTGASGHRSGEDWVPWNGDTGGGGSGNGSPPLEQTPGDDPDYYQHPFTVRLPGDALLQMTYNGDAGDAVALVGAPPLIDHLMLL